MAFSIPDGAKRIDRAAFALNYEIQDIKLPDSVEVIGN